MLTNIRLHFRGFCCTGVYKKFQISQFMPTVYSSILGIVPILCNTSFIDDTVIVGDVGMHLMWIRNGFFFIHTFFVSNTLLICRLLNRKNSGLFFALCFSQWWDALEWWRRTCAGNDGEGGDWKKKRGKKGEKVKRWKLVTLYRGSRRCFVWWGCTVEITLLSRMKNYIFLLIPVGGELD